MDFVGIRASRVSELCRCSAAGADFNLALWDHSCIADPLSVARQILPVTLRSVLMEFCQKRKDASGKPG